MNNDKLNLYLEKKMKQNLYPPAKTLLQIVKEKHPNVTKQHVKEFLNNQTPAFTPYSLMQLDLLDMQKFGFDYTQYKSLKKLDGISTSFNKGNKYIMIIIDVFSRYADAIELKSIFK
jgi:hypothetical protein